MSESVTGKKRKANNSRKQFLFLRGEKLEKGPNFDKFRGSVRQKITTFINKNPVELPKELYKKDELSDTNLELMELYKRKLVLLYKHFLETVLNSFDDLNRAKKEFSKEFFCVKAYHDVCIFNELLAMQVLLALKKDHNYDIDIEYIKEKNRINQNRGMIGVKRRGNRKRGPRVRYVKNNISHIKAKRLIKKEEEEIKKMEEKETAVPMEENNEECEPSSKSTAVFEDPLKKIPETSIEEPKAPRKPIYRYAKKPDQLVDGRVKMRFKRSKKKRRVNNNISAFDLCAMLGKSHINSGGNLTLNIVYNGAEENPNVNSISLQGSSESAVGAVNDMNNQLEKSSPLLFID